MTQHTPQSDEELKEDELLDDVLITVYKDGMLHGEAQANGVLPTPAQREACIVSAKTRLAHHTAHAKLRNKFGIGD